MPHLPSLSRMAIVGGPLIFVLALLAIGRSDRWDVSAQTLSPPTFCGDEARQEKIRAMMFEAVETSFKDHIVNLHSVWMKDERGQPHRASLGVQQGISAYIRGRDAVEAWKLPKC